MSDYSVPEEENRYIEQTEFEVGQQNVRWFGFDIHNPVFIVTSLGAIIFTVVTMIAPEAANNVFSGIRGYLETTFDWVYMMTANIFVLVTLALLVLPMGKVRLGGKNARPEFGYFGWFGMLFAAGMGIGLMFFGVLEPMYHFQNPPLGISPENTEAARSIAMSAVIFHWGLHPWAIYAVVALSLAFFAFNHGLPLTLRSAFFPILGDRVWGWTGHLIDILAVFATLFGLTTSLGFGAQQAAAGLNDLYGIPNSLTSQIVLILGITALALISVLRGLDGGVKLLSEANLILAGILLLFVIATGLTLSVFTGAASTAVGYVRDIVPLSSPFGREDTGFMHGWTVFYWAWWISWSPFVGMFIARVSYGRTVREFVTCVLVVPTIAGIIWMNAMGGQAIEQYLTQGTETVYNLVADYNVDLSIYGFLNQLPLSGITSFIAIVLVIVFFCTSSDSGSLVIDTITAGGKTDAPVSQRVFWCTFEGLVAIALLIAGGTSALQAMSIGLGFPFAIVLFLMMLCLLHSLAKEPREA